MNLTPNKREEAEIAFRQWSVSWGVWSFHKLPLPSQIKEAFLAGYKACQDSYEQTKTQP